MVAAAKASVPTIQDQASAMQLSQCAKNLSTALAELRTAAQKVREGAGGSLCQRRSQYPGATGPTRSDLGRTPSLSTLLHIAVGSGSMWAPGDGFSFECGTEPRAGPAGGEGCSPGRQTEAFAWRDGVFLSLFFCLGGGGSHMVVLLCGGGGRAGCYFWLRFTPSGA